jgi:putative membrane protein
MMASEAAGEWRGLEPASLLVNLIPDLWRTVRAAWPLLLAVLVGGGLANLVNLGLLALFLGSAVARTVLHFFTLRYRLHEGKLEIREGLLARRFRVIEPSRIQNVEIVQNVFHKLAGLVELRIETAGDSGAEGMLSALSVAEANALRERLHASQAPPQAADAPPPEEILSITLPELVGYGVSAGRVGAVVIAAGVAMEVLGQVSPQQVAHGVNAMRPGTAIGVGLLALAGGYSLSVAGTILRHYGFRMTRSPRGLRFEAGLLTRRGVEMALSKVQLARVDEPWMRRLMGYGTIVVETAASGAPGEQSAPEGTLPMVPFEEQADVLRVVMPALDADPWTDGLLPAAPRAAIRAVVGGGLRWAFLAGLGAWVIGPWAVALVPVGGVLGWLDWRRQGWRVTPRHVVSRSGFLTRRTVFVPREKIQSVHLLSDPLLRRYQLARVMVWVAGASVTLPALADTEARAIFTELSKRPRTRGPRRPALATASPTEPPASAEHEIAPPEGVG